MNQLQPFFDALARGLQPQRLGQRPGMMPAQAIPLTPPPGALNAEEAVRRLAEIRGGLVKLFNSIQDRVAQYGQKTITCTTRVAYMDLVQQYKVLGRNIIDELAAKDIHICQQVLDSEGDPTGECRKLDAPLLPPMYVISDCPAPESVKGAHLGGAMGIAPIIYIGVIIGGVLLGIAALKDTWLLKSTPNDIEVLEANLKRFQTVQSCIDKHLAQGRSVQEARALCEGLVPPPAEKGISKLAWLGIISAITVTAAIAGVVLYKALSPAQRAEREAARKRIEEAEQEAEAAERAAEEARERAIAIRKRRGRDGGLRPAMAGFGRPRRSIKYVFESHEG